MVLTSETIAFTCSPTFSRRSPFVSSECPSSLVSWYIDGCLRCCLRDPDYHPVTVRVDVAAEHVRGALWLNLEVRRDYRVVEGERGLSSAFQDGPHLHDE